jgi:hypothetical protein
VPKPQSQLDSIKVSCSPLTNNIQLYRMGKRSSDNALESKDVTIEAVGALIDHLMRLPNQQGVYTGIVAGRKVKYTISVVEEEVSDAEATPNGVGQAAGTADGAAAG